MSKATRYGPSPGPAQRRGPGESSDCAYSLEILYPHLQGPAQQLQNPKGQTEVKGPVSHWNLRQLRCPPTQQYERKLRKCAPSETPQGPPAGLTHGSDPRSGGEGRLLQISTLAGVELLLRGAERCPVGDSRGPPRVPPSGCPATPGSFGLAWGTRSPAQLQAFDPSSHIVTRV